MPSKKLWMPLGALVAFVGCTATDVPAPSKQDAVAGDGAPRQFAVAHSDTRLGTPSFVWLSRTDWPTFASADVAAREILQAVAPTFKLREASLATLVVPVVHDTGRGAIVARSTQRVEGVEVFRGGVNIVMSRAFEPVAISGLVAADVSHEKVFSRDALSALGIAHRALTGNDTTFTKLDTQEAYERFTSPGRLTQPARAKRVYFPHKGGLEPGWYVELLLTSGAAHSYVVSAATGKILFSNDLVRHDAFAYRVWASADSKLPMDGPQGNQAVPLVVPTRSGFTPTFGPRELVTLENFPFSKNDPWLAPGATTTSGNNVRAYSDVARPNGFTANTADTMASTTTDATFDYPYETATSAGTTPDAVKAAVTQLFYEINFLHDWYYDAGFDEKSGNHQLNNFGRGGNARDPVLAETQDYSGRNNANAATPADGASPQIQMFLFGGPTQASLVVAPPAANAGTKTVGTAGQFGKDSFALTAAVAVASDGGGDPADACDNINNADLTGKIALVHRGTCAFVVKAQKVEAAGAVGIIVVNVAASAQPTIAPFMGGTASDVGIPALSLSLADGQALEAAVPTGVSVTMNREATQDLDGAFDNQIVAHEWGHVLSNRLVADGSGLDTNQAGGLGEGWGDFSAMLLSVREEDALVPANAGWNGVYPSAAYASSGGGEFYFGIRRVPYSTDLTKDPLTFKHISNGTPLPSDVPISFGEEGSSNAEVHNTGEVWATMLWECYASLLSSGRLTFKQAQDRMKAYLVAGLKLTPPSPTLLEARDALLAAAYATDALDFEAFWKAFAKRGAGVGAIGPARDSSDNKGVKESFVIGNAVSLVASSIKDDILSCDHDDILDEDEVGTVEITVRNSGTGTLAAATAKLTSQSPNVSFDADGLVAFQAFKPFEQKTVKVKTFIQGAPAGTAPVVIDIAVSDPLLVAGGTLVVALPTRHGVDEVAGSSATDDVETRGTAWVVSGADESGATTKWARITTDANHSWFIPNAGEPADHSLTSPAFEVAEGTFTLSWRHRWSFESSVKDMKDFDGGVVEISLDKGKTWEDVSKYGAVDYNVTLDDGPMTTMPLKGRKAFGGTSAGYPAAWVNTSVTATLKTAEASAKVRFRHAADENTASVGWEIDDIAVRGLTNTPFWSFVPQRDECDPNGPTANAGPGMTVAGGARVTLAGSATHPTNLPLFFSWKQIGGPAVQLAKRDGATLDFEAPASTGDPIQLTFALRANDGALLSAPSMAVVIVSPSPVQPALEDGCSCRAGPQTSESRGLWTVGLSALLLALVRRRRSL